MRLSNDEGKMHLHRSGAVFRVEIGAWENHDMHRRGLPVARYWELPPEERRILLAAALLLLLARMGVGFGDIPRTRRAARRLAPKRNLTPQRLAELVSVASQVLPGATLCVPRAIVLEALLIAAGHAAELRIGVTPFGGRERPDAHAWVEIGGVAVGEDPLAYTALPIFGTGG